MNPFNFTLDDIYRILLLMFRTGAFIMTVPVFGHVAIPRMVRLGLIGLITFFIFPAPLVSAIQLPATMANLTLVIMSELLMGILMGFAVVLIFSAVQFAGHMIGLNMGLAVANIFDPMSAGQISIIGEFYYFFSLIVYLLINGHHYLILALAQSFTLVPVGAAVFNPELATHLTDITFMVFVTGIKLAAPALITLFIMNAVLGIVSRTVPQMNVFIVGFPLAIGVGLAIIGLSFPVFYMVLNSAFDVLETDIARIITLLQG